VEDVACVSLVAFEGFDTTSQAREIGNHLVEFVLKTTEDEFRMIKKRSLKVREQVAAIQFPSTLCLLPTFDVTYNDTPMVNSLSGSGGFSIVLDHGLLTKSANMTEPLITYHLLVTTCETTRKVVAVDGKSVLPSFVFNLCLLSMKPLFSVV
jgi:hypothetical protein